MLFKIDAKEAGAALNPPTLKTAFILFSFKIFLASKERLAIFPKDLSLLTPFLFTTPLEFRKYFLLKPLSNSNQVLS